MISQQQLAALPKVALHDHLDGGLRPGTVIEHCAENHHELPSTDPTTLGEWFFEAADSGSLERYLETFEHTVAAMQTHDQLVRVAMEFVLDQADDGVIYAEARYAPEQHLRQGLDLDAVVAAVAEGLEAGMAEAERLGMPIVARQILTAMRHVTPSKEIAELTVRNQELGVCGFDIAGAEAGFPPERFVDSFDYLRQHNVNLTIHAGEAAGPESIAAAVHTCGARRLGHGVRIVEDIETLPEGQHRLGGLAGFVRDHRIPLEVCLTSNLQTGVAKQASDHPLGLLSALGFRITMSCDNRLMSGTSLSREFAIASKTFGWSLADVERITIDSMEAAFLPYDERLALIEGIIRPAFAALRHSA